MLQYDTGAKTKSTTSSQSKSTTSSQSLRPNQVDDKSLPRAYRLNGAGVSRVGVQDLGLLLLLLLLQVSIVFIYDLLLEGTKNTTSV